MGEEEPEAKDWFGKNVKDGIGDDLGVDSNNTATIGNTPDANICENLVVKKVMDDLHGVNGPKNQGETSDSAVESLGLVILTSNGSATIEGELVDDNKVGNACESIPAPLLAITSPKCGKETGKDHDDIGNDSDEDVGTTETSQEAKVKEQECGGDTPVNITCPVNLAVNDLNGIWDMLVLFDLLNLVVGDAITRGHCEVRQESKGGDEGREDMEESFLLDAGLA